MANPVSHEQLAMWMTPHEIKSRFTPADFGPYMPHTNEEDMWRGKAEEATVGKAHNARSPVLPGQGSPTLLQSIREKGILNPVEVGPKYLHNGHHRVAAAEMIDKNYLIPVDHRWSK